MKKMFNVKNMIETLVNYSGEQSEMDKIWETFYHMTSLGFLGRNDWIRFYEKCKGWYIAEEGSRIFVKDSEKDDSIVYEYTAESWFKA